MQDFDGVVGIYSLENTFSLRLKEKFLNECLDVKIFQDFKDINLETLSYLIINLNDFRNSILEVSTNIKNLECKILVIQPLYVKKSQKFVLDQEIQNLITQNPNIGVLLVPDLLGGGVSYNSEDLSHNLIMQSILSERVKIDGGGQLVNTISVKKLSEIVVKNTFSFGISGQRVALVGPRKTKRSFLIEYLNVNQENIVTQKSEFDKTELYSTSTLNVEFSLNLAVKNTINSFQMNTDLEVKEQLIPENIETAKKGKIKKEWKIKIPYLKIARLLLVFIAILLTPFYLILISLILLYYSVVNVVDNNDLAKSLVEKSLSFSDASKNISFGNNFIYDTSNIIYKSAQLAREGIILAEYSRSLISKSMGDSVYDLEYETNNVSASLDKLHTDISFLQSEINDYHGFLSVYLNRYLINKSIDIGTYKNNLYDLKNIVSRSTELLGNDKPKKYLILFQNNMELRPTGGFIGSFALATFNKGRMTEIVVNDVYSADGQLKGHVDPPEPIRVHLGEGGWYLRDSNWDPDFPHSANKAEWFLDKEINEQVDGVIAIDLFFVKRLVSITGPIELKDFNLVVDQNNLYPLIQSEVEDEFFPGSIKKATILTSLSKSLINEIKSLQTDKYLSLFKELYQSLERKHVQLFLHDVNAQSAVYNLGYSGNMDMSTACGLRCVKDSYSLVEANLGVNKSNFYIKRDYELNLSINKEFVGHELFVTYENTANPAIGNMGVYKNYARIIVPSSAQIGGVREYDLSGSYTDLKFDLTEINGRQEAGFLIEVLPSTKKRIQIVWNLIDTGLSQGGQYDLKIIKQAGTGEDPLKINIDSNNLALTGRSPSSYNTTLATDFETRLFLK